MAAAVSGMEAAEAAAVAGVVKPPAVMLSEPPASAGLPHVSALVCKARSQWLKVRPLHACEAVVSLLWGSAVAADARACMLRRSPLPDYVRTIFRETLTHCRCADCRNYGPAAAVSRVWLHPERYGA